MAVNKTRGVVGAAPYRVKHSIGTSFSIDERPKMGYDIQWSDIL